MMRASVSLVDAPRVTRVLLHRGDVGVAAEPARDVARRQRLALEHGDDADHVDGTLGRDHHHPQRLGREPEALRREHPAAATRRGGEVRRHRDRRRPGPGVRTRNATGWIGTSVPGGSTGRCTPFWPPPCDERLELGEVAELRAVDAALRADRQRRADLRDHHADLAAGHLHPRELLHREDRPELHPQARHQHRRLVARPRRGTRSGCPRAAS